MEGEKGGVSGNALVLFLRSVKKNKKVYFVGSVLAFFMQLTGNLMVIMYSLEILKTAGVQEGTPLLTATVFIGLFGMLCTFPPFFVMHRFDPVTLMAVGFGIMIVGAVVLCIGLSVQFEKKYVLSIAGIALHLLGYGVGPGPTFWVIVSDLFPPADRGIANGIMTGLFQIAATLVSFVYLPIAQAVGELSVFVALAVFCLFILIFIVVLLPGVRKENATVPVEGTDVVTNQK